MKILTTNKKHFYLLLILIFTMVKITDSSIPTIAPDNPLLNSPSNYMMGYFAFKAFQTSSYFQIDFSQADIVVNDGVLNVTANLNGTAVNQSTITASCTSKICIIRLGIAFSINTNVEMIFGQVRNPKYTASQKINFFIYYGVNSNQTQTVSLSSSVYLPMPVTVNSVTQSDYGVGSQDVVYTFNVSFTYVPANPQISIEIPAEVGYNYLQTELSFYGTVQNISPFLTSNMIILSLTNPQILNPNGFMLLTLHGFRNPKYMGTSSSFNISMVQKKIATTSNCVTCRVAFLYANSSKLLTVNSTTPGDITMNMFNPSSSYVSESINLTIGIKIVAPIPDGGKFVILLPDSVKPSLPVFCQPVYGFTIQSPSYCIYNALTNSIQTVNFSIPYLEQTGDAIIKIGIINPKDNRQTQFNFLTVNEQNKNIGKNREPFIYSSNPLTLNATISKNITQIQSTFTLSSTITLTKSLNISTDKILVILAPSQFYNLTAIQCVSSSLDLNCSKTFQNYTKNLLIQFTPPCSNCNSSAIISFKILNLINPSFINDQMQNIQIQTLTNFGVIQTFTGDINLTQKNLIVSNLTWQGTQQIGSSYKLKIQYEIPRYIQTYGGYLIFNYYENSTYIDVLVNGSTYQYPQVLNVVDDKNQSLSNSILYFDTSRPNSLKQIKIKLCTSDSPCSNNLTISTLRRSFYPVKQSWMGLKATTLFGDAISTYSKDVSTFMPQVLSNLLSVNSTISITNTVSNYIFKFTMKKTPFQSGLRVDFSSQHKIQDTGRCFVQISPTSVLGYGVDCQIVNSSSFMLTYSGDLTFMTVSQIAYTITVINVLNPASLMPITYKIETYLSSTKNVIFSNSYTIASPYSLQVDQMNSTNTTYGQSTTLSLKLKSGYFGFDQMKVYIPKQNFKTFSTFNGLMSTALSAGYNFNENSTYFILDKIYTIVNSTFKVLLMNALSTNNNGKISVQMYVQGYISSTGAFTLPKIDPLYLSLAVSSSNRYVGQAVSLTFDINRISSYSQQKFLKIIFNSSVLQTSSLGSLFNLQSGSTDLYSYVQSVSSWSSSTKSIVLGSLKNMKFIPNNQTIASLPKIIVQTLDDSNYVVAKAIVDLTNIVPTMFKDALTYSFTRTLTESGNNTDLVLNFTSKYPQKAKQLQINLPLNQNKFVNQSLCLVGSTIQQTNCVILKQNSTSWTIQYPQNQTKITLKNVLNLFPSDNNLTLTLTTDLNQTIQQSSKQITPIIDYDPIEFSGTSNSSDIASPVKFDFLLKSIQNDIEVGSKLKFTFPDKIYSKILSINSKDCDYEISGIKYSGCQYVNDLIQDGKQWLQYIFINNLGPTIIPAGSIIKVTFYLTNPWTAYSFNQKSIYSVLINSLNQQTSKGILLLTSVYSTINSFTTSTFAYYTFVETNKSCSSDNTLTFNIRLPIILPKQTYLYVSIPSAFFDVYNQTGLQIVSQSSSFIQVKKPITDCSTTFSNTSGLCVKPNTSLSISFKTTNDKYLQILQQNTKITFYLLNDNSFVTSNVDISVDNRIPNELSNISLTRNNNLILSQNVSSNVKFSLSSTFNLNNTFKVSITPSNSSIPFIQEVTGTNLKVAQTNTSISVQTVFSGKQVILTVLSTSYNIELQTQGSNPWYVPNVDSQTYNVKIYDDTFVYFVNKVIMTTDTRLKPLSDGIQLTRSNSTVNALSSYYVSGSLSHSLENGRLVFNQSTVLPISSLTLLTNMKLGQFRNPISSNWDVYESVNLLNDTHILYLNNKVKTLPALQSLPLPANTIKSITYNTQMRTNTEQTLAITFSSNLTQLDKVIIKLPLFFKTLKQTKINSQKIVNPQYLKLVYLSDNQVSIQIAVSEPIWKIEFTVQTLEYQTLFNNNQSIIVETQYPTKSYKQPFSLTIYGTKLTTLFKMTSYKVNQPNSIEFKVIPLAKANTILKIYFPTFLNQQLQSLQTSNQLYSSVKFYQNSQQTPFTLLQSTGTSLFYFKFKLDQVSVNSNFTLSINSAINPLTDEPYSIIAQQTQLSDESSIFGHSSVEIKMTQLQILYIRSTTRNTSKIGVSVQINLKAQIPQNLPSKVLSTLNQQNCVINLPDAQVVRNTIGQCQIYLVQNSYETKLPCALHTKLPNSVITTCQQGTNLYSIRKGYNNVLYSVIPTQTQKPYIFLGDVYKMGDSSPLQTQYLTPIITSGSLNLNKIVSSSLVRLQKTILSLNTTLQNINQVDFVNFRYEKQHYLLDSNNLKCKVNTQLTDCWSTSTQSIMINITKIGVNNVNIQISGLINYLKQSNFTIRTLKYIGSSAESVPQASLPSNGPQSVSSPISVQSASDSSFALVDIFYSSLTDVSSQFLSNSYRIRVINPQNYVSDSYKKIQIIFDDESMLPSGLNKQDLKFNITSNIADCQSTNQDYSISLYLTCKFTTSMSFSLSVKLFHSLYSQISLSSAVSASYIYSALSTTCQNQQCDKCSTDQNGIEKCFNCRQNLYAYQNGCVQSCPSGTTEYDQYKTCEICSATCLTCYGLYPNNCLKCQNPTFASQDGQCVQDCYSGYEQNGFCIGDNECFDSGCRQCSSTGFCYQCLPDYSGQPVCKWQQLLPSTFMSYFIIPFAIYAIFSSIYFAIAKGIQTLTYQMIFSLSILQFSIWCLLIPALHTKEQAMVLVSMIVLRVVIGIVAYQTYYKKQINSNLGLNQQESLLQKQKTSQKSQSNSKNKQQGGTVHLEQTWKSRLIRFLCHTNGVDSYEGFRVLFTDKFRIEHNNLYLWISTGNRALVLFLMFYVLSQGKSGDLTLMPIVCILSSVCIMGIRLVQSEKVQQLWSRLRNSSN